MYDTIEAMPSVESRSVVDHQHTGPSRLWHRLALGVVLLISVFMNFYQLGQNGFANLYYSAAIRLMITFVHASARYCSPKRIDGCHTARAAL